MVSLSDFGIRNRVAVVSSFTTKGYHDDGVARGGLRQTP